MMMTTPERITELGPNEIFVYGSNYAGRHGKGAAVQAMKFGAKYGIGMGFCGQTYGIATKGHQLQVLSLLAIQAQVARFILAAESNPNLRFLATPIGCGLAGYKPSDIGPMFKGSPGNVILPASFVPYAYPS